MKFGLFSMPCHPPHRKHAETFDEDLDLLVLADQLGFDEAWLGEHYTSTWENIPTPDLTIAQALLKTTNIKLGTGVSCIPNHNPAQLAHRIAQLDVMAKGRFMWGVGVGAFPGDATLFEIPQDGTHRRPRTGCPAWQRSRAGWPPARWPRFASPRCGGADSGGSRAR